LDATLFSLDLGGKKSLLHRYRAAASAARTGFLARRDLFAGLFQGLPRTAVSAGDNKSLCVSSAAPSRFRSVALSRTHSAIGRSSKNRQIILSLFCQYFFEQLMNNLAAFATALHVRNSATIY
jgi:hypothetical protein